MKRIKYISRFAEAMRQEEIEELVERAAAKNASLDITGVLMTSGQLFFQVLEGPDDVVDALYAVIASDPRHIHVLLLKSEDNIPRRIFPEWSMRAMVLDPEEVTRLEPLRALLETIGEMRDRMTQLSGTLERALWAEMSAAAQKGQG